MAGKPELVPCERHGDFPLSFAQEELWFLDRLGAGATYNVPVAARLSGPLDANALERAFEGLARRHAVLRACFALVDGAPVQRVAPLVRIPFERVDLRDLPRQAREESVLARAQAEADRPFDLTVAPLLRVVLLELGCEEHVLLTTLHHAVTDGWSSERLLFPELGRGYEATLRGEELPAADFELQYVDFAAQEQQRFRSGALDEELSFWKRHLAEVEPLDLPADLVRPEVQRFQSASHAFELSRDVARGIRELGRSGGYSPAMVLLAAWQVLLARTSGQEDIAVGTLNSSRPEPRLEPLIGNFVRTLVVRTDLSGDPRFRADVLPRVREASLLAHEHQAVPFRKLLEELRLRRGTRHPIFQVMFGMQYVPREPQHFGALAVQALRLPTARTGLELDLRFLDEGERLSGQLIHAAHLFTERTASRMAAQLVRLIEGIVARPDARLSELSLLGDEERARVLVEWNDTAAGPPSGLCIEELFERQAARTPLAVALVHEEREVSFRELDQRAGRVARALRQRGVGVGDRVAICTDRSPDQIAGLLGILKAGAAWVPLDPADPEQRKAFLMKDAQVSLVLTQERLLARLPGRGEGLRGVGAERLSLDLLPEGELALEGPVQRGQRSTDADPAYVVYTSGSTGAPKGVIGSHRAMVNRIEWQWSAAPWTPGEVACAKTNLGFVDSINEIFGALCAGVPLVLVPDDVLLDSNRLVALLARRGVTRIVLVPSHLETILDIVPDLGAKLPRLSRWTLSGEALTGRLAARFLDAVPHAKLWNLYGATEIAADATVFEVERERLDQGGDVPIGRPIANLRCYVVDRWLQPLPPGIPGELLVGGAGVALGYLNRDDLTAAAFVADPFADEPGARLYRTGDLARYEEDGVLRCLGRRDRRVKLRGLRIELDEIEAVLAQHPAVSRAVTVKRDERLVAYVVPQNGAARTAELYAFLRQRLPAYMVPASIVELAELPRTASGKVDRKALPAPDPEHDAGARRGFAAPRDTLELQLTQIQEALLGVRGIGIDDDFFELGGHSLLLVRLFDRIEKVIGARLPLATFYSAPSVRLLADVLRRGGSTSPFSALVAIQPEGSEPPFYCVPASVGVIEFFELARAFPKHRPLYGFEPVGLDGRGPPHARVEDMAAFYVEELQRLQPVGPYHVGGQSFGGVVALEMAQQLVAQGQEVARLIILDTLNPPRASSPPKTVGRFVRRSFFHLRHRQLLGFLETNARKARRLVRVWRQLRARPQPLRRVLGAHLRARWAYAGSVYPGRITLIQSEEGARHASHEQWAEVCRGGVDRRVLPGGHLDLVRGANVRAVAEEIARCLDEAAEEAGAR